MLQYVKWSCQRRGLPVHDKLRADQFYTDPGCQDIFNNFMATITSRINSITGCPYRWALPPEVLAAAAAANVALPSL